MLLWDLLCFVPFTLTPGYALNTLSLVSPLMHLQIATIRWMLLFLSCLFIYWAPFSSKYPSCVIVVCTPLYCGTLDAKLCKVSVGYNYRSLVVGIQPAIKSSASKFSCLSCTICFSLNKLCKVIKCFPKNFSSSCWETMGASLGFLPITFVEHESLRQLRR